MLGKGSGAARAPRASGGDHGGVPGQPELPGPEGQPLCRQRGWLGPGGPGTGTEPQLGSIHTFCALLTLGADDTESPASPALEWGRGEQSGIPGGVALPQE